MPELIKISDALQRAAMGIRRLKDQRPGRTLNMVVNAYRGGEPMALLWPTPDRAAMLATTHAAAVGLGADVVVVTVETWHTTLRSNPVTGRPWQPDEMEIVADHHHGRERAGSTTR